MIDLNSVVSAISDRGLRLIRTVDSIRIEGNCPAELAEAIREHQVTLLPFVGIDPEAADAIAEQQAIANSESIRQQLQDLESWVIEHHPWALSDYTGECLDDRLAAVVDSQNPAKVAAEIAGLKDHLDAIDWAAHLPPLPIEPKRSMRPRNFRSRQRTPIARSSGSKQTNGSKQTFLALK